MKLRFTRPDPKDFVATLCEVHTLSELHCKLIAEGDLTPDCDVTEACKITLYEDYVNPLISFGKKNYMITCYGLIIGFADSDLSSLPDEGTQEKIEESVPVEKEEFYIDNKRVEHGCCWSAMIMRDGKLYTECDKANAKFICKALNDAYRALDAKNKEEKITRAAAHRQRNGIV